MPSLDIEMTLPGGKYAYLAEAKRLYENKQAQEAFQTLNDGIRINSRDFTKLPKREDRLYIATLFSYCGFILYKHNHSDKALSYFYVAQELNHKDENNYYYAGLIHLESKNARSPAKAVSDFRVVIQLKPKESPGYFYLSVAYYKMGYYELAIDNLIIADDLKYNRQAIYTQIEVVLNDALCVKNIFKEHIVELIKRLPDDVACGYIDRAIDQRQQELLSKKMWSARFFTKCSLEKGTLKELVDYKTLVNKRKGLGL